MDTIPLPKETPFAHVLSHTYLRDRLFAALSDQDTHTIGPVFAFSSGNQGVL